jgi:YihY family inner membrane protein
MVRAIDRFQRRHVVLAFPFGVVKKFGDDQAGTLAALIAYYGFFSLFPLLLVFVSVLGIVLSGHPGLREAILRSALGTFPVIGNEIGNKAGIHALTGSWLTVVLGTAGALWAGLGVAQAAEKAMNTVWDIPKAEWPNFIFRRVRALGMLALLGTIVIVSTFTSGWGSSGALSSLLLSIGGWAVSFLLNLVLFLITYQVLTARQLRWLDVLPGAVIAAVAWTVLQAVGGFYVTHEVSSSSNVYGTFALVIGILIWISLGAQLTLFCAEINVVRKRHLWPRSLVQPPINSGDKEVYRAIVHRARMRPEVAVRVWFTQDHEPGRNEGPIRGGGPNLEHVPRTEERTEALADREGPEDPVPPPRSG